MHVPSGGWTLTTLADHLLSTVSALLGEMDKRYEQRFRAQEKATDTAFLAQEKAIQAALAAAKEAVSKAETAVEKRFDNTNEWRNAMNDRDRNQMPRIEIEQRFDSIKAQRNWTIGIVVSIVLGIAAVIVSFVKH